MSESPVFSKIGLSLLQSIYGKTKGSDVFKEIKNLLPTTNPNKLTTFPLPLTEKDSFLICYGDSFIGKSKTSLTHLDEFCNEFLQNQLISFLHILPFCPSSGDGGFSISDYVGVNKDFGGWKDIEKLGENFKLMSDLVLNHCSKSHEWFKRFLNNEEKFKDYFIAFQNDKIPDLSSITRPRALPLLTKFPGKSGELNVWTTFSADQVDLNFESVDVLIEFVKILIFYIKKGINVIRFDAVAYVWKEIGTKSIHHQNVHSIVKLFRAITNEFYPNVMLITETNVPHTENISYFGNGKCDEASLIYNFTLPPLTLFSFLKSDATYLSNWADKMFNEVNKNHTYFNFLASHDGIGVTPLKGYLNDKEFDELLKNITEQKNGRISYKNVKGGKIPYEMNINYLSAICGDLNDVKVKAKKFLASQAVMLSFIGVPAIYYHSLIGSENWSEVEKFTENRSINREKLDFQRIKNEIKTTGSLRNLVFEGYKKLLSIRMKSKAFHPAASMKVVDTGNRELFTIIRNFEDKEKVFVIINVSDKKIETQISEDGIAKDLISGKEYNLETSKKLTAEPYCVMWLKLSK